MSSGRRRSWLRLDANYYNDPRVMDLPPQAELLYVRALAYCKAHETGGALSMQASRAVSRGLRQVSCSADALVRVGLWEATANGWQIPRGTWEKWQAPGAAEIHASSRVRAGGRAGAGARARPASDQTRPEQTLITLPDPSRRKGRTHE